MPQLLSLILLFSAVFQAGASEYIFQVRVIKLQETSDSVSGKHIKSDPADEKTRLALLDDIPALRVNTGKILVGENKGVKFGKAVPYKIATSYNENLEPTLFDTVLLGLDGEVKIVGRRKNFVRISYRISDIRHEGFLIQTMNKGQIRSPIFDRCGNEGTLELELNQWFFLSSRPPFILALRVDEKK